MRRIGRLTIFPILLVTSLLSLILLPSSTVVRADEAKFTLVNEGNPILMRDDFSQNPVNWMFLNASRWTSTEQYLVLTQPGSQRVGVVWLDRNISSPFTAEFRYKVGGGSGADGFVFMFYKNTDYEPGIGGYLGFLCRPVEKPCPRNEAPGYGLEFDSYFNSKEVYVNDSRVEDNQWHNVKLIVKEQNIKVFVDGSETLSWSGSINRSFTGMGFSSGIWGQDNWHIIDDFKLYGNTIAIKNIQPNWTIKLIDQNHILTTTTSNNTTAVFDTAGLTMPLQGRFTIYDEKNNTVYESPVLNNIWGGDILTLQTTSSTPADTTTSVVTTTITHSTTFTSTTTSIERVTEPAVYAWAISATATVAILIAIILLRKK
jgi:hypothetical protein